MEGAAAGRTRAIDMSKLLPAEYAGFGAALVLFGSLFLPWFAANPPNGMINDVEAENVAISFTAWDTYGLLDWLLVAACSAPFILAWIIARGHALTWRPGEVTMIVGLIAVALIVMNGIILGKPGEPNDLISFKIGYWVGLLGAMGIVVSGFFRQAQGIRSRKPPGVV